MAHFDPEPERYGGTPHLSDYWQVISRRLWLLLLIFTITTASSIWAFSRSEVLYQSAMSLQRNDPAERQRGLVMAPRLGGIDIFVDPMLSEIQVLTSSSIASVVVDSLGMRLVRVPSGIRSELARDIYVAPEAPDGSYRLIFDAAGSEAQLFTDDGTTLGGAAVGEVLDGGFVRFVLQPPPMEARAYDLAIVPTSSVVGEVRLNANARESTNIIDVSMIHADPILVPQILNQAGLALREKGAERVRGSAEADQSFIQARLDTSYAKLRESRDRIRDFKRTAAFTSLSAREQRLVAESEDLNNRIERWDTQRRVLTDLVDAIRERGVGLVDLAPVLAELPPETNPQVRQLIDQIQGRKTDERRLLTQNRFAENHPAVVAVRTEIRALGDQLMDAAGAARRVIGETLAELTAQEAQLRAQQAEFPELEARLTDLEAQAQLDRESHQFLMSQLYQAGIAQAAAAPYLEILDRAGPAWQVPTRGRMNVMLGALLGVILGIGAAFFLEYLDRTVRTSSDVESLLGIPVLGVIPRLRRIEDASEGASALAGRGLPLVVAMDPLDPAAEAYRNLRMNLMFMSAEEEPIRTLLFSSPGPSEGKSTTAVNFAVMLAQQGQRVLLIDSDLRRPSLHRALDLLREPGLTNLLVGDADVREAVRPNVLPNLDFLPSGPFPPNPSELLNSKTMVRILDDFEGRYDQVIIDSPPVLAVTDAAILAVHTDGAVIVLRSGETEQRAAERTVDQLRRLQIRVFGAVLNEVSAASPDESYYLQYYYSYAPHGSTTGSGFQRLRDSLGKVKFFG